MSSIRVLSPAKVNLGLAVLRRRDDGYHEIDTIMAMIDLCDEITLTICSGSEITILGMDDIPVESNLMWKAVRLWIDATGIATGCEITIDKRIPSPAGLGGGSSNAAAVLRMLNEIHDHPLRQDQLHEIASKIGADCPFFLDYPTARATGIGTDLQPVPAPPGWLVLAIPQTNEPAKTARLYGALTKLDYGDVADIDVIEQQLAPEGILSTPLFNSFMGPATNLFPGLPALRETMIATTQQANLSGAGPALFAIAASLSEAEMWASSLRTKVPFSVTVFTARFLDSLPSLEISR